MLQRILLLSLIAHAAAADEAVYADAPTVPKWTADAVWYQIFPERFRNGDPGNDPTVNSLEIPIRPHSGWDNTSWTQEWYKKDAWEDDLGESYYASVFDRRYGGDLQGVIDKLDYLKELGVTALYFNPVFHARSLHKYDGSSYHHIDPYFGPDPQGDLALMATETSDPATWHWTEADKLFLKLIEEAHKRDMRIIIDGVWNHTGRDFFAFMHLMEYQEDSPYKDWYIVRSFDDPATDRNEFDYESWWGFKSLPIFRDTPDGNDQVEGPKKYVFDATSRWMDPNGDGDPSDGIDGWRLDVAEEVPAGFWRDWNAHVRSINPEAYTVAEAWGNARHFLDESDFSAAMNYDGFAVPVKDFIIDNSISAQEFAQRMKKTHGQYPLGQALGLQNLMDSHDTDRVASMIVNSRSEGQYYDRDNGVASPGYDIRMPTAEERDIQRMIAALSATYVGAPMIYYGTEAGMWSADDPCDRMPMVWFDMDFEPMTVNHDGQLLDEPMPIAFDRELFDYYKRVFALRHYYPATRHGTYSELVVDDTKNLYGFSRVKDGQEIITLVNRSDEEQRIELDLGDEFTVALASNGEPVLTTIGHDVRVTVPPMSTVILANEPFAYATEEVSVIDK